MSSRYTDPQDFVMHTRKELVADYLKKNHNVNFPIGKKAEKQEDFAARFIDFMWKQDEKIRDMVFMELEYINFLSSPNHIDAICAYAKNIDRKKMETDCKCYDERALWTFTHHQSEFDSYYEEANLEDLSGAKELTLPKTVPSSFIKEPSRVQAFETKVQGIYRTVLKGDKCKIKVFDYRDQLILRAYLEDLPTKDIAFDGSKLDAMHLRKPVFDAVFIYSEKTKTLAVRALGGKPIIAQLQEAFCSHFLGINNIDTNERRYALPSLSKLTNIKLAANATYGVERAYLKLVRIKHKVTGHKITVNIGGKHEYAGTNAIQQIFEEHTQNLGGNEWEPDNIQIAVVFRQTGKSHRRKITASITPPNTCNLKNREQDAIVRQLLKDWGIDIRQKT